ncbi:YebC/PmpR family DNA-binding transcriptional regulator [Pelotomaculum terephthalicicum JT]|uniref:YebC/PmpR family DNA-binding transcriptional regulator n=1 Tax=Pelotomaculum TaxID=191373 RepID=UPI0009C9BFDD|nr:MULTISPECIES: YebC/PmpR family DNA-binding transcriptional regulator [Pelotomaculum]MCG9969830.1 YebC/PmpR family DNA-binding transcriptional regulator [Pelotomaculum terephthalicicum JT]OPX85316.1 MAG: putative transcriptional regulatory protein [Pelotomaculum sp. PtaB.Bin117]OPY62387.1 MAG: putative transcriptional regulatory protein [Pelotomaculum sp. PtaU1.Bin065]
MSGHSKWATIKRKKAKVDAQRGKLFTRLAREIMVAARQGGKDPDGNVQLKTAIQKAKEANIPNENIMRAIQKGAGELGGASYEEFNYEGYGPGGVAVMIEIMTDNRNRTASEIRYIFSRNGGSLGESGCVAWVFQEKGLLVVEKANCKYNEDDLMLLAIESGAEDFKVSDDDSYEITTEPGDMTAVKESLEKSDVEIAYAEVTKLPLNTVKLEGQEAEQMVKLIDSLEEHDDVQNVYTNFETDMLADV